MQLFSLNDIFSAPLIKALCWTLVHSVWLGLLLSLLTGFIMLATRKSSAALRYNLLTGVFFSFLIAMIVVFVLQIAGASANLNAPLIASSASGITGTNAALQFYFIPDTGSITSAICRFFDSYASTIVLCWFIIIVYRSIRFAGGIKEIHALRNQQLTTAGDHWNKKLRVLSQELGIKRSVSFFQSGIAAIPMVAGHFKPVILFPAGLLLSLPPEETEAILIHELAHIRRKDFLVNMTQHFAEILFFFNPAVLWVSSLIKIERENSCDDIAVANTGNKRNYINALVSFQEYHLSNMQYAPALADTEKHLLQRVKRMLYDNTGSLNNREKTSLTICLLAVATTMILFSNAGITSAISVTTFSAPVSDSVISISEKQQRSTSRDDATAAADNKISDQDSRISDQDSRIRDQDSRIADQDSRVSEQDSRITEQKRRFEEADAKAAAAEDAKKGAGENAKEATQEKTKKEVEWRKSEDGKPQIVSKLSYSINTNINNNIAYPRVNTNVNAHYSPAQPAAYDKRYYTITGVQYNSSYSPGKETDIQDLTKDFINDLSAANIITGTNGLSYKMSAESLIVNGAVQPERIHKKLKDKYLQSEDWKLLYNWKESR